MNPVDILIAIVVPTSRGLGLVFAKPVVDQFSPTSLMASRFWVSAMLLARLVRVPRASPRWLIPTVLGSWLLLSEALAPPTLAGGALIRAGVSLMVTQRRPAIATAREAFFPDQVAREPPQDGG